jgi:hypothetical protein
MMKLEMLPQLRGLFAQGGVRESDYGVIRTAVTYHSLPDELARDHAHWRLTSLLKDVDGLDRVRLGDLNPRYLRNSPAREMPQFARALFDQTDGLVPTGPAHFAAVWSEALRIASDS